MTKYDQAQSQPAPPLAFGFGASAWKSQGEGHHIWMS